MREPRLGIRGGRLRRAVVGIVLACAASTAFGLSRANADTRPALVVRPGRPAEASYAAPLTRGAIDARLGVSEVEAVNYLYPPPEDCARPGCDLIPIDVYPAAGAPSLLAVSATWSPEDTAVSEAGERVPGVLLALWDRGGPGGSYRQLDAEEGKFAGQAVVRLEMPGRTRYWLTVAPFGLGQQVSYGVVAELRVPRSWPLDTASTGGTSLLPGGVDAAAFGRSGPDVVAANDAAVPASSDPFGTDARLGGLRALSARARHQGGVGGLSWWWVAVVVLLFAGVAGGLWWLRRRGGVMVMTDLRRRFRDLRLFWKLLVPFVAALLVIGLAGAFLTTRYLASNADTTLNRTLVQRSVSTDAYVRDQEVNLLEAERFAANLQGVPDAAAAADRAELAKALASAVAVNKGLDVLAVTDATGHGLVEFTAQGSGFVAHSGADWSAAPAVREVLAGAVDATGDKHVSFVRLTDSTVWLLTAGPVRTDHVIGAAVAGIAVPKLAAGAATAARAQVGLYDLGGHLLGASGTAALPARLAPSLTGPAPMRQRSGSSALAYAPLVIRGVRVGTAATRIARAPAYAAVRGAAIRIALLVALAMAAVIGFGALVSRYVVGNVESLLATNRALGAGDLSVRAPVRSGDELGELAGGFNQMAEQLQASYAELERRVAERTEELSRLYADNLAASEARAQFFASVSHEFRTPLFAILANVELLDEPELGAPSPAELAEGLGTIDASAKVLLERVNEILDLARAETTGVELDTADLTVADAWFELAPTVGALARAGELTLVTDLGTDLPAVRADPARLRQILLNVISNAIKYTPAGGRVTVSATHDDGGVHFAVADTGPGIPKAVGDKVFEPYYRVKGSRARGRWASTGLGLALTKRLVEAHGGRIWFESSRRGTTFHLTIPAATTTTAPTRRKARAKGLIGD